MDVIIATMVYLPCPNEIVCKNNSTIVCTGVPGVVVRGDGNMVIIDDGLVEGKNNSIGGDGNTIRGDENDLDGHKCTVIGNKNIIRGNENKIRGKDNKITGLSNEYECEEPSRSTEISATPDHTWDTPVPEEPLCCAICFTNMPSVRLDPCGHSSLCGSCYNQLQNKKQCPICRTSVKKAGRIIF